ncbi:hypothetical protein BDF21DRAFT_400956 [Thamnidium elegans]|nr:hypothetical protein BDF21DRAFT_400956 [Thamnidium elegans]
MTTNRSFTIDTDPKYKATLFFHFSNILLIELCNIVVIRPVFLRFNNNGTVDINEVLLDLEDVIVESYSTALPTDKDSADSVPAATKISSLKEPFTEALKEEFMWNFNKLDKCLNQQQMIISSLKEIFTIKIARIWKKKLLLYPAEERQNLELKKMGKMEGAIEFFLSTERLPAVLEYENMYMYWSFLNTICYYSKIHSISQANSSATNLKRKLSSIEEIGRKAVGRRTDDSKDLSDGYFELPIVMKDMLKDIIDRYTSLRNDVNIIGYNIQKSIEALKVVTHSLLSVNRRDYYSLVRYSIQTRNILSIETEKKFQDPVTKDSYK